MPRGTATRTVNKVKTQEVETLVPDKMEVIADIPVNSNPVVKQEVKSLSPATVDTQALISLGLEKGVSIDTMERLFNMRKELKAETAKEDFFNDFSLFQSECPIIQKNRVARSERFAYEYASLDAIIYQVQPYLTKYGFSFTFKTEYSGEQMIISCEIHHKHGHMEATKLPVVVDATARMNAIQKVGSAITYTKRYTLCDALGLGTADADDDGQATEDDSPTINQPVNQKVQPRQPVKNNIEEQPEYMELLECFFKANNTNEEQKKIIWAGVVKRMHNPVKCKAFIQAIIDKTEVINTLDALIASLKLEVRNKWVEEKERCETTEAYKNTTESLRAEIKEHPGMVESVKLDEQPEVKQVQPVNRAYQDSSVEEISLF